MQIKIQVKIEKKLLAGLLVIIMAITFTNGLIPLIKLQAASKTHMGEITKKTPSLVRQIDVKAGCSYEYTFTTDSKEQDTYHIQLMNPQDNCPTHAAYQVTMADSSLTEETVTTGSLGKDYIGSASNMSSLKPSTKYRILISDVECDGISHLILCVYSEGLGGKEADRDTWYKKLNIQLSKVSMTLLKGGKTQLKATLDKDKNMKWKSSDKSVATVDTKGVVTAKGYGKAVITCTSKKNPGISAACMVIVTEKASKITLNKTRQTIYANETFTLKTVISPKQAANQNIEWSSSNNKVATVDENGIVTGIEKGNATIAATVPLKTGDKVKAVCTVTVKTAKNNISDISIKEGAPGSNMLADFLYGGAGANLYYTLTVGNYSGNMELTFSSGSYSLTKSLKVKKNTTYHVTITLGFTGYQDMTIPSSSIYGSPTTIPAPMNIHPITVTLPDGSTYQSKFSAKGSLSMIGIPNENFYKEYKP